MNKTYDLFRPYFYKFILRKKYNRRPAYLPGRVGMSISAGCIPIWIGDPSDIDLPFPVRDDGPYVIINDHSIDKIKSEITLQKYKDLSIMMNNWYNHHLQFKSSGRSKKLHQLPISYVMLIKQS